MKSFFLGAALSSSLIFGSAAHAQGSANATKEQRAYSARIESAFRANLPAIGQFTNLLKTEATLQTQLQKHTITQKQYAERSPKAQAWHAVIPKMRAAIHQVVAVKPVPASMADVNKGLMAFSTGMDKGLTRLDHWADTRKSGEFKAAAQDIGMGYVAFMRAAQTARAKNGPKPR